MEYRSPTEIAAAVKIEMLEGTPALQAIRRRLGSEVPVTILNAYDKCIPAGLRGILVNDVREPWAREVIAVALGEGSGDLAVVACRWAKDLAWFRQHNPAFQNCLITLWNGWALLWLRSDARPKNLVVREGWMWLTRGAIPVSWPGQSQALIHTDEEPVQVCFAKLQWPPVLSGAFRVSRLAEKYGPCFRQRRGRKVLNDSFWANWLVETSGICYHPKLREFRTRTDNSTETVGLDLMIRLVSELLQNAANAMPESFPMSELKLSRIRQLIRLMKVVASVQSHLESAALKPYSLARLTPGLGALTTAEIWLDYVSYCNGRKLTPYTRGQFLRILPAHLRELFGLNKSHDIRRQGRQKRGFRGLGLSSALGPPHCGQVQTSTNDSA